MPSFTRRLALKLMGVGSTLGLARTSAAQPARQPKASPFAVDWSNTVDRVWLDGAVWANPMEDWRVVNGAAECQTTGGNRNIHALTHQLTRTDGGLTMSVTLQRVEVKRKDGGAGFRFGIRSDLNEYRSNCFVARGIDAGVRAGELFVGNARKRIAELDDGATYRLELTGAPDGEEYRITLTLFDGEGNEVGSVVGQIRKQAMLGNLALVNNFDAKMKKGQGARYRFRKWSIGGDALSHTEQQKFGPILWSMYSLSDSRSADGFVMKLSALTGPLSESEPQVVELQIRDNDRWRRLAEAELDRDAWTATFRITKWNQRVATRYRLVYRERRADRTVVESFWEGTIRANPEGRPLRMAALTCQKDYAFPYQPVADNVVKMDPDLIYFSGDQLYENHGGYGIIREPAAPAILNYLRKFYMFGWAFREAMRDRPTICIPDDHDVFQGNIWGEGGAKMRDGTPSSAGGYREPARMVNAVHRTCAGHHPDYFDAKPVQQGISVYYGDMVYGNVGFAILGDRQFKSGPEHVETGSGRADHVTDSEFDTSVLDKPGLVLLGQRQETFLKRWAADWRGHEMKVLLSQTVFAGAATHHGRFNGYLKADLDSGGWPQTARNRAINILRPAKPLHINGDQHLTSLLQYGVEKQRDSCWSFCTPAIAAGYPRWWRPDEIDVPHRARPRHGLPNTGEFLDGFGNRMYVYAVGNPEVGSKKNRYELAHQKGSGFGFVTIDTEAKTYAIEAFRFLIDAADGKPTNQFDGWPVVLHMDENEGRNRIG